MPISVLPIGRLPPALVFHLRLCHPGLQCTCSAFAPVVLAVPFERRPRKAKARSPFERAVAQPSVQIGGARTPCGIVRVLICRGRARAARVGGSSRSPLLERGISREGSNSVSREALEYSVDPLRRQPCAPIEPPNQHGHISPNEVLDCELTRDAMRVFAPNFRKLTTNDFRIVSDEWSLAR
jgi:hypothetical protein